MDTLQNSGLLLIFRLIAILIVLPISVPAAPVTVEAAGGSSGSGTQSTTLRWHEPCAGGSRATETNPPEDFTPPPFDANSEYKHIREKTVSSLRIARDLKGNYVVNRTRDVTIEDSLTDLRLEGIPEIPPVGIYDDINAPELLNRTYGWLVRFAVFLEQMRIDEYEMKLSTGNSFITEVIHLEEQCIYWLLCKLKVTLRGHNLHATTDVTRDLLSEEHTGGNRAARNIKNIIVLRDLEKALKHLQDALVIYLERSEES